jgi:hypothetical protein
MLNVPQQWIREETPELRKIIVPSWTTPGKTYDVIEWKDTGELECECPGDKSAKRKDPSRNCHHIQGLKWFTVKPANRKGVQDTSVKAFKNIDPKKMSDRRKRIYQYLRAHPECDRLAAKALGFTINFYTGARNALTKDYEPPLIQLAGYTFDEGTKETVMVWGPTNRLIDFEPLEG